MLGRLILILLQIALGWFGAPLIAAKVPVPANLSLFLYAAVFAIIIFIVGLVAANIIKEVSTPNSATLTWALVAGLIGAVLAKFGPVYVPTGMVSSAAWKSVPALNAVLGATVLGYHLKR
jgi:hypothetical protein